VGKDDNYMGAPSRAWLVWAGGAVAYSVAVLNRTSFGVASLEAADRFHTSASVLSGFVVLQLLVYAGLQIPVGMLLDRFGVRRLLACGAAVMVVGQAVLAVASTVPVAVLGRALVGAGDAFTFISVLRLVAAWFPARRVPVLSQITGLLGQSGQVLSVVPLVALLHGPGWTVAFLSAAGAGMFAFALVLIIVRDGPEHRVGRGWAVSGGALRADLVSAWRHPGTRLGLWTHFTTQFPGTVFALMWGLPFLESGERVPVATASAVLIVFVVAGVAVGPVIGVMVQRHPLRRSWLVFAVVAANVAAWTAVLLWPGQAPLWLLLVLVLALAAGGAGSMVGFDFARTFNPASRLGTATGIVNVGGFTASLIAILLIGVGLDLTGSGGAGAAGYHRGDFRLAMATQYLLWAVGLAGIITSRRRVRRRIAEQGFVAQPLPNRPARRRRT
jgi:MFS family permease